MLIFGCFVVTVLIRTDFGESKFSYIYWYLDSTTRGLRLLRLGFLFFFLAQDESFESKLYEQVEIRGVDDAAGHKIGHLVVT